MSILQVVLTSLIQTAAESAICMVAGTSTGNPPQDGRDDPVYKQKHGELIERNKKFEEERERREKSK